MRPRRPYHRRSAGTRAQYEALHERLEQPPARRIPVGPRGARAVERVSDEEAQAIWQHVIQQGLREVALPEILFYLSEQVEAETRTGTPDPERREAGNTVATLLYRMASLVQQGEYNRELVHEIRRSTELNTMARWRTLLVAARAVFAAWDVYRHPWATNLTPSAATAERQYELARQLLGRSALDLFSRVLALEDDSEPLFIAQVAAGTQEAEDGFGGAGQALLWLSNQLHGVGYCMECGELMAVTPSGVAHHIDDNYNVDYDQDANHVPFADEVITFSAAEITQVSLMAPGHGPVDSWRDDFLALTHEIRAGSYLPPMMRNSPHAQEVLSRIAERLRFWGATKRPRTSGSREGYLAPYQDSLITSLNKRGLWHGTLVVVERSTGEVLPHEHSSTIAGLEPFGGLYLTTSPAFAERHAVGEGLDYPAAYFDVQVIVHKVELMPSVIIALDEDALGWAAAAYAADSGYGVDSLSLFQPFVEAVADGRGVSPEVRRGMQELGLWDLWRQEVTSLLGDLEQQVQRGEEGPLFDIDDARPAFDRWTQVLIPVIAPEGRLAPGNIQIRLLAGGFRASPPLPAPPSWRKVETHQVTGGRNEYQTIQTIQETLQRPPSRVLRQELLPSTECIVPDITLPDPRRRP